MDDFESMLPEHILAKAIRWSFWSDSDKNRRCHEYGWRKGDVIEAITAAASANLAAIGGCPMLTLPNGIIELYWLSYGSTNRNEMESWKNYVKRSAEETLKNLRDVMSKEDKIQDYISDVYNSSNGLT